MKSPQPCRVKGEAAGEKLDRMVEDIESSPENPKEGECRGNVCGDARVAAAEAGFEQPLGPSPKKKRRSAWAGSGTEGRWHEEEKVGNGGKGWE